MISMELMNFIFLRGWIILVGLYTKMKNFLKNRKVHLEVYMIYILMMSIKNNKT